MQYNYIQVYKEGYNNYVNFMNSNDEISFSSTVFFNDDEIYDDPDNCFLVRDTYCDELNELLEEDDCDEDEITESYYELSVETYDLSYTLIVVLSLLQINEDEVFYIYGRNIFLDRECKKTLPIFKDMIYYIDDLMNEDYESNEEKSNKIIEGVEFIKNYYINS